MSRFYWLSALGLAALLATASSARAQRTPYIGFVYPAGGEQGTTFQIRLGGQRIDSVYGAHVSGAGVSAKLVEYRKKLSNQEVQLLREQLRVLKGSRRQPAKKNRKYKKGKLRNVVPPKKLGPAAQKMVAKIESRMAEWVNRPACASLASIANVEVTISPDAEPGAREIRLVTRQGVTNPLVFYVSQVPEVARKPMITATFQVLGKEAFAQRKRPPEEVEDRVTVPCTMNGQIASGEVNWYRFDARKGQRLVVFVKARELIPFIADAVPGWFQPVVTIYDADGKELVFDDDYRFKPDPTLLFNVPSDGEYLLAITDAIYRGREDFVYRLTIGEVPFLTSIFPLGGRVGEPARIEMNGWNLERAKLVPPAADAGPGIQSVVAVNNRFVSNRLPFALDTLPECFDRESNETTKHAQKVELPVIVNGRIDRTDDWDVFQVRGRAGQTIVADVDARRLESPVDSIIKVTDASGKLLALNDDHEDPEAGINTHDADSYVRVRLPADGTYFVHLGDTERHGGPEYAYRLRISRPRPDFSLRVVPSNLSLRSRAASYVTVHAIRKDGFTGDIKVSLKDPPPGFLSKPVTLTGNKSLVRMRVNTRLRETKQPVNLVIQGVAKIQGQEVAHDAVPAEDRMQAFLWRHLVPAQDLETLVYNPAYKPPPQRILPPAPAKKFVPARTKKPGTASVAKAKPKFTKRQVAGRLRQLKALYEDWMLTDDFYRAKVAECEAVAAEQ